MAKAVSAKDNKTADMPKVAVEVKAAATEKADKTAEKNRGSENEPQKGVKETAKAESKDEKPFKIGEDGLVEVFSENRKGKSVYGTTGEIVTFDEKGIAKVKIEDALHFAKVPGFSFK